jgi:hypothetical protein
VYRCVSVADDCAVFVSSATSMKSHDWRSGYAVLVVGVGVATLQFLVSSLGDGARIVEALPYLTYFRR